mmetsp:Transcript_120524/g.336274  ORF Transcript_120524/g.336274 Transcript_120524/m.336274 type:complete len:433 (-) Transcript_120524:152-1450(-)
MMAGPTLHSELYISESSQGPASTECGSGPSSPPGPPPWPSSGTSTPESTPPGSPRCQPLPPPAWSGSGKSAKGAKLSEPLLGDSATLSGWDRVRIRLGLTRRASFRLAVLLALLLGVLLGACSWGVALGLLQHLADHRLPWRAPTALPKRRLLEVNGRNSTVYGPSIVSSYPWRPVPVVIVLHGSYDTPKAIEQASRFNDVAEWSSTGFIVVYPNMAIPGGESWGYNDPMEKNFFRALIEKLGQEYAIRRNEVYVCGHSNGGTMALFLQNNLQDLFQAAAAVEAGVGHLEEWQNESLGRPTMVVWNHDDPVLHEFGGEALYQKTIAKLRRHDPVPRRGPSMMTPLPAGPGGIFYAEQLRWDGLAAQPPTTVISWSSVVPTHNWLNPINVPGGNINAAALIWGFFQASASFPPARSLRDSGPPSPIAAATTSA